MLTPENSLLLRSIPLLPPGPPPHTAHQPTRPATYRTANPTGPATRPGPPTLPACLPCLPARPPQVRQRRGRCEVLVPSPSSCKGCMCGMQVKVQPTPLSYTSYLPPPIFYVPPRPPSEILRIRRSYLIFYVPPPKFYVSRLIFCISHVPQLIFYVLPSIFSWTPDRHGPCPRVW